VLLKQGENWKLIKDSEKGRYCYLIRINDWAIELEENEFNSLYKLLKKIKKEMQIIQKDLMEEELINLELENLPWYAELEGTKFEWSLRFVFESIQDTRSFEMYWPIQIAKNLSFEIIKMWESMH
tara:strand:- start:1242 stop:1616 length:375 start_codon:yes stop_codon:yes gene_type:complete